MHRLTHRVWCVPFIVGVIGTAACNNLFSNSTNPSNPSTTALTETFSGPVAQGGAAVFNFTETQTGTVNVTLTALNPASSVAMGLGIGTPSGTNACTLTTSTSSAVAGSTAQITTTENAGSYCIKVFDVGNLTAPSTVTVTVAHS